MLMYGSNFWRATFSPGETSSLPIDAAAMPLPSEETTPPVTKMKRVRGRGSGIRLWNSSLEGLSADPAEQKVRRSGVQIAANGNQSRDAPGDVPRRQRVAGGRLPRG